MTKQNIETSASSQPKVHSHSDAKTETTGEENLLYQFYPSPIQAYWEEGVGAFLDLFHGFPDLGFGSEMTTPYPVPVAAAQVGTYFVGQYYQVLQQEPDFVYQFYSDSSTMLRVDGNNRETASNMLEIHALIMSLNYTGVEIKTGHALASWNSGVLVMVSGSVQAKDFSGRRKFMETFFLAPQDKGYFVFSDVFHFIDEEPIHHNPSVLLSQSNSISEPVPNYLLGGEIAPREFVSSLDVKQNGPVDNYSFPEQQLQQFSESENILERHVVEETNDSLETAVNYTLQDHLPASVEESAGEPQKHTYASILLAKGQSATSVTPQHSIDKTAVPSLVQSHVSQPFSQQSTGFSNSFERSGIETFDDAIKENDEIRSVYVRNLLPSISEAEIEEEFKNFGKIAPEGVVIRSRNDVGVCYAFVEFEDMAGVHNAVKAGSAIVAGRLVFIEERRPSSNIPSRFGRGRGRGRGSYQIDATRGRFGARNFGRGVGYDVGDRDYNNRTRGNGFYRPTPRQDRGVSGHHVSRSGQNQSE